MKTFSRPEISGWNPRQLDQGREAPCHAHLAARRLVMPATRLSTLLLPEPFRPMMPSVVPAGTATRRP